MTGRGKPPTEVYRVHGVPAGRGRHTVAACVASPVPSGCNQVDKTSLPVLRHRTDHVGPGPQTRKNCVWEPDPPPGVVLEPESLSNGCTQEPSAEGG